MVSMGSVCKAIGSAALLIALCSMPARGAMLSFWDFNDSNLTVDAGSGTLTTSFPGADVGYGTGTTLNGGASAAGNALRLNGKNNNNASLTFALSTSGYENLILSYATMADSGSFTTQSISYSTDGNTFVSVPAPTPAASYTTTGSYATASFDFSAISALDNLSSAWVRITFAGAGNGNNKYNYLDNVKFDATSLSAPAVIDLSNATGDTIITGGTGSLGLMVANSAGGGSAHLNYSSNAAIQSGSAALGAVTPATGDLPPGLQQAVTVAASSSHVGQNIIRFTVSDPAASNSDKTLDATLTVLAHANAAFANASGAHQSALLSNNDDDLTIDFGSVAQNAGGGALLSAFDLLNLVDTPGFTAALDLDETTSSGDVSALALLGSTTWADLAAGSAEGYQIAFDTSTVGSFSATYQLKLSDQDLPGASEAGSEWLTLNVTGSVYAVPEPGTLMLVSLGLVACRTRRPRK